MIKFRGAMSKIIKIYETLKDIPFTEKIFSEIATDKIHALVKAKSIQAFPVVILDYTSPYLTLTPEPLIDIEALQAQKISTWFEHKDYLYIFESVANVDGQKINLDLNSGVIFQQQKRTEFRFEIPPDYPAKITDLFLNEKPLHVGGRFSNISATGALLCFTEELSIHASDTLRFNFTFANNPPIEVSAIVRHSKKENSKMLVGAEFRFLSPQDNKNIQNLIFQLRIELFDRR